MSADISVYRELADLLSSGADSAIQSASRYCAAAAARAAFSSSRRAASTASFASFFACSSACVDKYIMVTKLRVDQSGLSLV